MKKTTKCLSLIVIMMLAFVFSGCYFKSATATEFETALKEEMGAPEGGYTVAAYTPDNTPIRGCNKVITYYGNGVSCTYLEFLDDDSASNYFNRYHENFEDIFEDSFFKGECKKSTSGSRGYVYLKGSFSCEPGRSLFGVGQTYGGVYCEGNVVVMVITHMENTSRFAARDFLKKLGYPYIEVQ
ncbi:MAG: hypothetical protein MJ108_04440 [Saccharofermentans sp.]|nr:hypothetical protein [Saccharofermentans sp.]